VGAFVLTALVTLLALQFWVTRPLARLSRSLEQESPAPLEPLRRNRAEFGTLAERLIRYFEQKVELVREVAVRKQLGERLEHMAHHDALTGVPNRILLQDRLAQALARARRSNNPLAVLMIDLDGFKAVNDQLGHDAGDQLLREAACRMGDLLRKGDTVARVGGDEFVVLAPDLGSVTDAARVAHRVLTEVGRPYHIRGQDVVVGASIGVAMFPLDGDETEVLLGKADTAMYRVKGRTRNDYEFYTRSLSVTGEERSALEAELRVAIAESGLLVRYTPRVDLSTFRVCGAQASAFWQHPTKGLLPPEKFAALAEETGHLGALCELILRTVCADAAGPLKAAAGIDRIAVRLAPSLLRRPDLGDWLQSVLRETGAEPARIELEVPEAALAVGPDIGLRALLAVRALGLRVSIGDFGAGSSPLTGPGRFGADGMRIASTFTDDVVADPEHRAIVTAVLALARSLGERQVVVGKIVSEEQLVALQALGCKVGQGPLLSEAVPADRLAELAAKGPLR
jgi:diguanylate cyclase (GGDEF)-like protein